MSLTSIIRCVADDSHGCFCCGDRVSRINVFGTCTLCCFLPLNPDRPLSQNPRAIRAVSAPKRRNTLLSLHKKKKQLSFFFFGEHLCQNEMIMMTRKQVSATPVHPFCRFLSNKGGKRKKKTLGISFYPVKPRKLLPAPRVEELLCCDFQSGCFISFSRSRVNCTSATSRQQAVLEGRLSPVGCAGWIRRSDS